MTPESHIALYCVEFNSNIGNLLTPLQIPITEPKIRTAIDSKRCCRYWQNNNNNLSVISNPLKGEDASYAQIYKLNEHHVVC